MGRAFSSTEWSVNVLSNIQFSSTPLLASSTMSHDAVIVTISDVAVTEGHGDVESKHGPRSAPWGHGNFVSYWNFVSLLIMSWWVSSSLQRQRELAPFVHEIWKANWIGGVCNTPLSVYGPSKWYFKKYFETAAHKPAHNVVHRVFKTLSSGDNHQEWVVSVMKKICTYPEVFNSPQEREKQCT